MDMKLRAILRNFIRWQIKEDLFKDIIIDYEIAEHYLEETENSLKDYGVLGNVRHSTDKTPENPTDKYKYCNHHHEIGDRHELIDFGDGDFVANKEAIPLLKALNEIGLQTRSHHINEKEHAWICVLLDNAEIEVKKVFERDSDRTKYNGKMELLIKWRK